MQTFTMTYWANKTPRTTVLLQRFHNIEAAAQHAMATIKDSPNDTTRVLIRMGDAAHTDPVIWDSADPHQNAHAKVLNKLDNLIHDLEMLSTRAVSLKVEVSRLLGT